MGRKFLENGLSIERLEKKKQDQVRKNNKSKKKKNLKGNKFRI